MTNNTPHIVVVTPATPEAEIAAHLIYPNHPAANLVIDYVLAHGNTPAVREHVNHARESVGCDRVFKD